MSAELDVLAAARRRRLAEYEDVHRKVLDAIVAEVEAGGANVQALAAEAGISRQTIYNELARRQEHRDTLEGNGHPPAPAPHDADTVAGRRARGLEPIKPARKGGKR